MRLKWNGGDTARHFKLKLELDHLPGVEKGLQVGNWLQALAYPDGLQNTNRPCHHIIP